MRIGSLNNVNLTKWQSNDQRDVFIKSIPGYMMPLSFDLNSSLRTHIIDGILADASNANLAADMEYLESLFRTGQLVWVDATDQYPSMCSFGKIAKLQGPTIDSSQGPYVAKFTIEFWSVPPWGTVLLNPWKQTGFKLRDIDGVGAEYMLDPTQMHCNFSLNEINQSSPFSASWEFILDNQNPFTNVTSKQYVNCDSLGIGTANSTNPIATDRNGNLTSITIDSTHYKEGTGSLKGSKTTPAASTWYDIGYDFGSAGMNFSSFDRFRVWYMCDQASQTEYQVYIADVNYNGRKWSISLLGASTWQNVLVSLGSYTIQDTGFDITHVRYLRVAVNSASSPPSSINLWMDDVRLEVGYITHCDDTMGWSGARGSSQTYTVDSSIFKSSYSGIGAAALPSGATAETTILSAMRISGTSSTGGDMGAVYSPYVQSWDLSTYDYLLVWVRSDFGGNGTGYFYIFPHDNAGNTYNLKNVYGPCNANQWYRLVVPIGSTRFNNVLHDWEINSGAGAASATTHLWISEPSMDIGNYAYMEMMLPDNLLSYQIQIASWNGSSYNTAESWGTNGYANWNSALNYILDGTELDSIYGSGQSRYMEMYPPKPIASTVTGFVGASGASSSKTYSATYGTNNRAIFAVKMPPMTSDSVSGNYPSNDLSGFQGINKMRFKITVFFPNDDTTYSGFNSL